MSSKNLSFKTFRELFSSDKKVLLVDFINDLAIFVTKMGIYWQEIKVHFEPVVSDSYERITTVFQEDN